MQQAGRYGTFYETLGVTSQSSQEDIDAAFLARIKECHPDGVPCDSSSRRRFDKLGSAYFIIGDPMERRRYDHHLCISGNTPYVFRQRPHSTEDLVIALALRRVRAREDHMSGDAILQSLLKEGFPPLAVEAIAKMRRSRGGRAVKRKPTSVITSIMMFVVMLAAALIAGFHYFPGAPMPIVYIVIALCSLPLLGGYFFGAAFPTATIWVAPLILYGAIQAIIYLEPILNPSCHVDCYGFGLGVMWLAALVVLIPVIASCIAAIVGALWGHFRNYRLKRRSCPVPDD